MTLQMNEMSLIMNGFKYLCSYKKFEKNWDDKWACTEARCYQKDNECVIKMSGYTFHSGYTFYYDDKEKANKKIIQLIKMGFKKDKPRRSTK